VPKIAKKVLDDFCPEMGLKCSHIPTEKPNSDVKEIWAEVAEV
jgi:hypothetical protein